MKHYDVIVIGSGGGTKIISPAAKMGLKVAAIEKDKLGGTCLNRGCIPSKMLIHPADVAEEIRNAHKFDIHHDTNLTVDFAKLVNRISQTVDGDSESIVKGYAKNPNIDYIKGTAKFISNKVIEVNGEQLTAEKIFIGVGTRPSIPPIEGLEGTPYWTSTEALRNTQLPKRMIILGASYIAVELGHAYGALGCNVEFIVRSKYLRKSDGDISDEFNRVFKEKHTTHYGFVPKRVEYKNNEFHVYCENANGHSKTLIADQFLIATGVDSNADTLELQNTDIELDEKNFIKVNSHLETAVENVYALGDCIGRYFFRHSVNFEGEFLFRTVFVDQLKETIDYPPVPHAVFSNPQVAGVGLTEEDAQKNNMDYVVGLNPYAKSAMGMAFLSDHGFCKIIIERSTRKLIGAHIIGAEASDMIHMLIAYMNMNATLDDLLRTIYIHPALPEIIRNAARKAKIELDKQPVPKPASVHQQTLEW